jgi:transposase-like protein
LVTINEGSIMTKNFKPEFRQEVAELIVDKGYSVREAADTMNATRESFNSWRTRGICARRQYGDELFILINQIFKKHDGSYGSPKITREPTTP